jgi:PAS domain S-box-containing protein
MSNFDSPPNKLQAVQSRLSLALRESEGRYRALFDAIDEGFCVIEVLFDGEGRPQDYRFLETNPAFEKQTGFARAVGKTIRELVPNHEQHWFEKYGRVALTGVGERFEDPAAAMGRYYDVFAFRIDPPELRRVGVLFNDISERKREERALRESEARQAFLLQLGDALHPLADPAQIQFEASRLIGEHLSACRAGYGEYEDDGSSTVLIRRHYTCGVAAIEGRRSLHDFGATLRADLLSGSPIVLEDVATDARLSAGEKAAFAGLLAASMAVIPLVKSGRLLGLLFVHYREVHRFTPREVALLGDVAERTWAAIDRARAEAALRHSEARFRALATATSDVVYRMSPDWAEMRQLHGRNFIPDTEAPTRDWIGQYIPVADRPHVMAVIHEAVRTRSNFELEHRVLRVDGSVGWTFSRAVPMENDRGEIIEWFGAASDITSRKTTEEALRESENQFRTLANAIPQLSWTANADGWISWYNERWYQYTGTTPEQMEGWGWQSVHDPKMLPQVLERWKTSIATGTPLDMVFPLRGADGVYRPFLTRVMPVFDQDGKVTRWFGTNTDISEQRKIEEALRESEERLRLAQQAAGIGAFDWNVQTGIHTWTPELESLYGLQPGSFAKTQRSWEEFVHPEDRAQAVDRVNRAFRTGEPGVAEWRVIWPDGSIHWLTGKWQVFTDHAGAPERLTGVHIDITERKELEEQFRQAQRLESIGRLAGGIAHDFNNLLTIIGGYSRMIAEDLDTGHPVQESVGEIRIAAERAAVLTHQLLAFSRRQPTEPKNLLLDDLVRDTEKMLRRLVGEKIDLSVDLAAPNGVVRADPGQLEQVIVNLVVNAKDAMPDGGRLLVETGVQVVNGEPADDQVTVPPGPYVFLVVSDTGTGMSDHVKANLFEPFFTTKAKGSGTGLGLATVYGIVKQSEAAISVQSEIGKGSTFRILFPAIDAAPEPASPEDFSIPQAGAGTILVVEDEPGVRDFIGRTLARQGFTVLSAPNGREALALLRGQNQTVDLLLTDVVMPEMDGLELSAYFAAEYPGAPMLLMSGYAEGLPDDHAGPCRIQKPFTSVTLLSRIHSLLRRPSPVRRTQA